jgi:hypothetical protein
MYLFILLILCLLLLWLLDLQGHNLQRLKLNTGLSQIFFLL